MTLTLQQARSRLEQDKGKLAELENQLARARQKLEYEEQQEDWWEQALSVLQKVAQETQQELEYHISDIVTSALEAVFPDPYKFVVEFAVQRGKTEANLYFERDGNRISPLDAAGGGACDIASFALRVAVWSLAMPRTRNVLILDEPFKWLSRDMHQRASLVLKELSQKLGLQIIMVSHSEELIEGADKVFRVTMRNGRSKVKPQ